MHFSIENRTDTKIVYTDIKTYQSLNTEQKKIGILIKNGQNKIRISLVSGSRFFVNELMHQRSKTNMLSKLKFVGKVLSGTVTSKERFSLKYLYEYKLKHVTVTLTKDNIIMPKLRKASKGANFRFFFFQNR